MISEQLFNRFYSGNNKSGTHLFYTWIRQNISKDTVLLNLGAGPATDNPVRVLKGEVARVVGADIDPVVLENNDLDEARVIANNVLPFPEGTFDVALSDFVLEHIDEPLAFLDEVHRVLKPGGSFFFRTPNVYHYVTLIARATPHWVHDLVANRARGLSADAHEPYETYYRLNSRKAITKVALQVGFKKIELRMCEAEPSYLVFHAIPFLAGVAYERTVNRLDSLSGLRVNIFGRLVKYK